MNTIDLQCYENMKRVYICHPYRADPTKNIKKVENIVNKIGQRNAGAMPSLEGYLKELVYIPLYWDEVIVPIAPILAFPPGMSEGPESSVTEEQGMAFCLSLLFSCNELWVYAKEPTGGMVTEIEAASRWGKPVIWRV